jgi:hypothetical protein
MYESTRIYLHSEVDNRDDGCDPATAYHSSYELYIAAPTVELFVQYLLDHTTWNDDLSQDCYQLNSCGVDGRIDVSVMVTEDHHPADATQIAEWKAGKRTLRHAVYSVYVQHVTRTIPHLTLEGSEA